MVQQNREAVEVCQQMKQVESAASSLGVTVRAGKGVRVRGADR